jgi:hypothetical protein
MTKGVTMNRSYWRWSGAIALTALVSALAGVLIGGGAASAGAAADLPKNTATPTISGAARDGETLRVSAGTWSGTQPMTFSYQWNRCSAQLSNCAAIAGATQNEFTLTTTDVGKRLLVTVMAKNAAGGATAQASTDTVGARASGPTVASLPTISGTPVTGQTLTATAGRWNGTTPIGYAYQWQRCDAAGNGCANVAGATGTTFALGAADVQHRLRVVVTAKNTAGSGTATSGATALVAQAPPPGPSGQIKLPSGMVSIPAASVAAPERLVVDRVSFAPSTVRSRAPFSATFRVVDTRGYAVRDALVFVRSTPLVTTTPGEARTGMDGTVTLQIAPESAFPLRNGHNVQFFVRARKDGDNVLAGVSSRRLVQVRTASPSTR